MHAELGCPEKQQRFHLSCNKMSQRRYILLICDMIQLDFVLASVSSKRSSLFFLSIFLYGINLSVEDAYF